MIFYYLNSIFYLMLRNAKKKHVNAKKYNNLPYIWKGKDNRNYFYISQIFTNYQKLTNLTQ